MPSDLLVQLWLVDVQQHDHRVSRAGYRPAHRYILGRLADFTFAFIEEGAEVGDDCLGL
jgi:hypothetical protein